MMIAGTGAYKLFMSSTLELVSVVTSWKQAPWALPHVLLRPPVCLPWRAREAAGRCLALCCPVPVLPSTSFLRLTMSRLALQDCPHLPHRSRCSLNPTSRSGKCFFFFKMN